MVEVRHSETQLSIDYRASSNFNHTQGANGPVIHPTCNKEVKALLDAINAGPQSA